MHKILFIDDDRYFAKEYLDELKKSFNVVVCYDAESAVRTIKESSDFDGIIVDVMMPPPRGMEHETNDGFTTGIWIVGECLKEITSKRMIVLLFTNRALSHVKDEMKFMNLDDSICSAHAKDSIDADELPHKLSRMIGRR